MEKENVPFMLNCVIFDIIDIFVKKKCSTHTKMKVLLTNLYYVPFAHHPFVNPVLHVCLFVCLFGFGLGFFPLKERITL